MRKPGTKVGSLKVRTVANWCPVFPKIDLFVRPLRLLLYNGICFTENDSHWKMMYVIHHFTTAYFVRQPKIHSLIHDIIVIIFIVSIIKTTSSLPRSPISIYFVYKITNGLCSFLHIVPVPLQSLIHSVLDNCSLSFFHPRQV